MISTVAVAGVSAMGIAMPGAVAGASVVTHQRAAVPATSKNYTTKYHKSWLWKSRHVHMCVTFKVWGKFTYTVTDGRNNVRWTNQRLRDPALRISFARLTRRGRCVRSAVPRKVDLAQHWTGYKCSFNPSISLGVGVPPSVSIGVSGWPSCGQRNQVIYSTSPPNDHRSYYNQYNSGSPTAFGDYTGWSGTGKIKHPCYGVFPSGTVYAGPNSDSFGAGNLSNSQSVCL